MKEDVIFERRFKENSLLCRLVGFTVIQSVKFTFSLDCIMVMESLVNPIFSFIIRLVHANAGRKPTVVMVEFSASEALLNKCL